jgi:hypothetical protein
MCFPVCSPWRLTRSAALPRVHLCQIDVLEAQVGELESAVAQLDSYSKRLEMKFSALHLQMG